MPTTRRTMLRMAGACAATLGTGGLLGACGAERPQAVAADPAGDCSLGSQPPNPIEEFVCCDARNSFANEAGLPNPVGPFEEIASGFIWAEGPVWVGGDDGRLLFSDVPGNAIYQWDGRTASVFLSPSGLDATPTPHHVREAGANGMALGRGGLLICDGGNRCISRIDLETRERTVIADRYDGKRFNSPNDLVVANNGDIYFTDPPTGINAGFREQLMEFAFRGVFRIRPDNSVDLIADNLRVNGIALTPDNRTLVVNDSSGWVAIDLDEQGLPVGQRLFFSADAVGGRGDGMKIDEKGRLWTSGPGGIHVVSPDGQHIGFAPVENRLANCAFGPGGYLYVANCHRVVRARIDPAFA